MNDRSAPLDRRLDRRIPLGCNAVIRPKSGEAIAAECVEISIGGMTLRAAYVPGEAEIIEVTVHSPDERTPRPPLVTRLQVKRCHAVGDGVYEIGGAIVRVVE